MVLKKDFVGDTQLVFACTERLPDVIIIRPWHDDIDKTVCIENYFHLVYGVLSCRFDQSSNVC